jgi:hypothetical protein
MPPAGSIEGILDADSCRLSDDTAYSPYRLDLPVRGRIELTLSGNDSDLIVLLRDASGRKLDSGVALSQPVEAGNYTVLVNGRTPGQLGRYAVKSAFTAEPGLICSAFPSIGFNQTVTGTLGVSGCLMPNGQPYEAYFLNTFGSGILTVTASGAGFSPVVIVRVGDGELVSSGASVEAAVSADSRYQVVVYSTAGSGNYQIATSFQPSDDETCRPLRTFTEPDNDTAAIGLDGCSTANPAGSDLVFFNYYELKLAGPGLAALTASGSEFTPTLNILDASGNVIATDSGSGGSTTSVIRAYLRPGAYLIQVISTIATAGTYQLTYGFTAGPPQPCRPVTGSLTQTQTGTIFGSSCRTGFGPADVYGFNLAAPGTLDLDLSTFNFTSVLALRDAKENLMVLDEDRQALGGSHVSADLTAGYYTVTAAARYDSGDYQLAAALTTHDIPPCTYVQAMDINGGYIQRLGARSCHDANGQPVDFYEFTLTSDSLVAAVMTSSEIDGRLTLTGASGNILRSDENSYGLLDPLIVQYLPAGTYRLEARAAASSAGGYYQVDLRTLAGPRPSFCASKAKLDPGANVMGTIQFSGCPYNGSFADIYEFHLGDATSIDVQLTTADFDAYLILLDEQGNLVDEDDNSGGDTNARITNVLPAGTYYIVARPSSEYFSAGNYILSLGQTQ